MREFLVTIFILCLLLGCSAEISNSSFLQNKHEDINIISNSSIGEQNNISAHESPRPLGRVVVRFHTRQEVEDEQNKRITIERSCTKIERSSCVVDSTMFQTHNSSGWHFDAASDTCQSYEWTQCKSSELSMAPFVSKEDCERSCRAEKVHDNSISSKIITTTATPLFDDVTRKLGNVNIVLHTESNKDHLATMNDENYEKVYMPAEAVKEKDVFNDESNSSFKAKNSTTTMEVKEYGKPNISAEVAPNFGHDKVEEPSETIVSATNNIIQRDNLSSTPEPMRKLGNVNVELSLKSETRKTNDDDNYVKVYLPADDAQKAVHENEVTSLKTSNISSANEPLDNIRRKTSRVQNDDSIIENAIQRMDELEDPKSVKPLDAEIHGNLQRMDEISMEEGSGVNEKLEAEEKERVVSVNARSVRNEVNEEEEESRSSRNSTVDDDGTNGEAQLERLEVKKADTIVKITNSDNPSEPSDEIIKEKPDNSTDIIGSESDLAITKDPFEEDFKMIAKNETQNQEVSKNPVKLVSQEGEQLLMEENLNKQHNVPLHIKKPASIENEEKNDRDLEDDLKELIKEHDLLKAELERIDVSCSQSAYRLFCSSGKTSQFVYRWEAVDGKCQSFVYGYCFKEFNEPHPRSRAECEQYCLMSSKFVDPK